MPIVRQAARIVVPSGTLTVFPSIDKSSTRCARGAVDL